MTVLCMCVLGENVSESVIMHRLQGGVPNPRFGCGLCFMGMFARYRLAFIMSEILD